MTDMFGQSGFPTAGRRRGPMASFGGGFGSPIGAGVDPAIVAGLIGWTLVEGLVVGVLSRFA